MKLRTIVLGIIFTAMSINTTFADRRYNRHYSNHYPSHRYYSNSHRRSHFRHYNHGPRRYYNHYHGDYAAFALGGLIVGGILGTAINNSYNESRHPAYTNPVPTNSAIKQSFILQPDGSCYVISHVNNGRLVLSPVASANCQ